MVDQHTWKRMFRDDLVVNIHTRLFKSRASKSSYATIKGRNIETYMTQQQRR
jgi:hypothetical protein